MLANYKRCCQHLDHRVYTVLRLEINGPGLLLLGTVIKPVRLGKARFHVSVVKRSGSRPILLDLSRKLVESENTLGVLVPECVFLDTTNKLLVVWSVFHAAQ